MYNSRACESLVGRSVAGTGGLGGGSPLPLPIVIDIQRDPAARLQRDVSWPHAVPAFYPFLPGAVIRSHPSPPAYAVLAAPLTPSTPAR